MNILISGADGNLGSAVVQKLKSEGHKIYGLFGKKKMPRIRKKAFKKN